MSKIILNTSVWSIIAFNLVLLGMTILFDWKTFDMIVIFWLENLVIGFYNILKMVKTNSISTPADNNGSPQTQSSQLRLVLFFLIHYFGFCAIHYFVLTSIFADHVGSFVNGSEWLVIFTAIGSNLISHGISFWQNFIGKKEYEKTTVQALMFAPYRRIAIVHLTILGAGLLFTFVFTGQSIFYAIAFFILKIAIDIWAHTKAHSFTGSRFRNIFDK